LDVDDLVQLLDHVDGDADRARLVGDRAGHRLPDPPRRVGRELVALAVVELLDRPDQAERPLLDQVEKGQAAAEGALRDRDDELVVRGVHLLETVLDELLKLFDVRQRGVVSERQYLGFLSRWVRTAGVTEHARARSSYLPRRGAAGAILHRLAAVWEHFFHLF